MTREQRAVFRRAVRDDVPQIIALLADDPQGAPFESPEDTAPYWAAFDAIDKSADNLLVVAEVDGRIAGTLQITYIPGLTYTGGERAQIEGVRISPEQRGQGVGQAMIGWAIEQARTRGCRMVQLATDRQRPDIVRFYQKIGFRPSHTGMRYHLSDR